MSLIKLLYLADRKMLVKVGQTITGDRLVSMKHGPVLSYVLDLINHPPEGDSPWAEYVGPPISYEVELKAGEPANDELSKYELTLLEQVYADYGHMNRWNLVELLHQILPEWKDTGDSVADIDPEEILRLEKWPEDAIADAKNSAIESRFLAAIGSK